MSGRSNGHGCRRKESVVAITRPHDYKTVIFGKTNFRSNRSKSLRVLDQWRAQMGFRFEDRCLRAIERFAADQIIDDLLGNQLPIEYNDIGDDIGDLRKWEAGWSSSQRAPRAGHQSCERFRRTKGKERRSR